jgi:membrane-associated phospholipid phosphatase
MTRRAYGFAVGLALGVGLLSWVASDALDIPLRDPDGMAGPSYVRLPLVVLIFLAADAVPRVLIRNRGFRNFRQGLAEYLRERWTRSRISLVVVGLASFYVVYVAYRNLKGFLPFVLDKNYDRLLEQLDRALMFGHDPATVLHTVLGTGVAAHVLSFVYIAFLMFVPVSLGAALVWSKNVSTGFWYVTALCINWVLGVASYYWVPAKGPFYANASLFNELPTTGVSGLQDALIRGRDRVLDDPFATDSVQSIAAFASLHVSIIFTAALITHYVIRNRWVRWTMWVYFVLTTISTVYFGWHYILDDIAGAAIGWLSVWIGAMMTGHKMRVQRHPAGVDDGVIGVFPPGTGGSREARSNGWGRRGQESPAPAAGRPEKVGEPADRTPDGGTRDPAAR